MQQTGWHPARLSVPLSLDATEVRFSRMRDTVHGERSDSAWCFPACLPGGRGAAEAPSPASLAPGLASAAPALKGGDFSVCS